jgi:hypothetical protein
MVNVAGDVDRRRLGRAILAEGEGVGYPFAILCNCLEPCCGKSLGNRGMNLKTVIERGKTLTKV